MKSKESNKNFTLMSTDELRTALVALKRELFVLRVQRASHQIQDTSRISKLRKDVARVMTALSGRRVLEERS